MIFPIHLMMAVHGSILIGAIWMAERRSAAIRTTSPYSPSGAFPAPVPKSLYH